MATNPKCPKLNVEDSEKKQRILEITAPLRLPDETVKKVMDTLDSEMDLAMNKDPQKRKQSSCLCENTYVRALCDGTEDGDYLALDLGGTNFRVIHLQMKKGLITRDYCKEVRIPEETLCGPSKDVYEYIADSICVFLEEENLKGKKLPLGFTFSFPMTQKGLKSGILITWTKSFRCKDGVGDDAGAALEAAMAKREELKDVELAAILNDTTGTIMAGAYADHKCYIGVILGTGCNASYLEHIENIDKWNLPVEEPKEVVIDIEWGAFGDNGCIDFIKTDYDREVDKYSNHVGSFTFEKYFAGMYMGETVRLILLHLTREGLIFNGKVSETLGTRNSLTTTHATKIEKDNKEGKSERTLKVIEEMGLKGEATEFDISVVKYVCEVISIRAGQLVGGALAALCNRMKRPEVTVAVDGSLYQYHPRLHDFLMQNIEKFAPETKVKLILVDDGSGKGAGLVAAVVDRLAKHGK
ncbi:hexokinase-1-like [Lingula anatina]|uniref:Phosphotransferase n=1 Tax=Lingula anatina TaxID=7574 RepID=A0A1S3I378_LINAN|nr:hexokinase-1-like [Lingula anatina]|eukprot:XP_013391804.1 hexokinase-1-like [Lingula anatina]